MPIVQLVITLVVIGVIMWLVNRFIPMDANIKQIMNIVVLICVILWIVFGVFGLGMNSMGTVPRVPSR